MDEKTKTNLQTRLDEIHANVKKLDEGVAQTQREFRKGDLQAAADALSHSSYTLEHLQEEMGEALTTLADAGIEPGPAA